MTASGPNHQDDPLEAAANWDARLRLPANNDEDRRRFGVWLQDDPSHKQAFDDLQASLALLCGAASTHPELRAMSEAAREAVGAPNRWRQFGAIAATFVGLIGGAAMLTGIDIQNFTGTRTVNRPSETSLVSARSAEQVYRTAVGERSIVTLADGSRVTLNTASRISVLFEPHRRHVVVLAGQALFEVAHDPERSFIVRARDKAVTAHGTVFDVRVRDSGMEVTLIEGRVTVAEATKGKFSDDIADLTPGQQFVSTGARGSVRSIDVIKQTSWRDGRVFFEDQPLTSAVMEMNRYSQVKIVADPALAEIRINGMFKAGQQQSFVRALEAYLPIEADIANDNRIELRPRP